MGATLDKATGKIVFPKGEKVSAEKEKKFWAELTPATYAKLVKLGKDGGAVVDAKTDRGVSAQENKIVTTVVELICDNFLAKK